MVVESGIISFLIHDFIINVVVVKIQYWVFNLNWKSSPQTSQINALGPVSDKELQLKTND